jgi:hypothetical protein
MNNSKKTALVLIILSLIVAGVMFSMNAYRYSTLNIDATAVEKGVGTVFIEGNGSNGSSSRNFQIDDNQAEQGMKKLYVIELPALGLKSLKIVPQVPGGYFGIDRIILANDSIRYIWDENGICSQQKLGQGFQKKEPCIDGTPTVETVNDASIVISAIPETGFTNPLENRIAVAIAAAFVTFLGGAWLLWPFGGKPLSGCLSHYGVKAVWLVIAMLFMYQLFLVNRYAVDIPTMDEWTYFTSGGLMDGFTWKWLMETHNEHQIVITKLMAWLNLKLFGLNFVAQNMINLLLFGGLLAAVAVFKNKMLGREKFAYFPLFLIFLLSPIIWENHLWAFQSQFHLVLLFSMLMLYHAFRADLSVNSALLFSMYAILAIFSFSAGVIFVVTYLLCITVFVAAGIKGNRLERAAGWRFLLIVCGMCGVSIYLWSFGYEPPEWPRPKALPSDYMFWNYFFNIISFGFGFKNLNILPGIVCLLLVAVPPILLVTKKETRWQPTTWLVLSSILGILMVLAAISVGRAWIYPSKTSRYAEIGFMLIPYSALGWWLVMKEGRKRIMMLSLLWIFCLMSYSQDLSTYSYAEFRQINLYDLECIEDYYSGVGNGICQGRTTPGDLDRAKRNRVNFTKQFLSAGGGQ